MRLVFTTSDYMNTDISDECGHVLYSVSTSREDKRITTIIKYRWCGPSSVSETMAKIEWHELKETLFRFNGDEIEANTMLGKRRWSNGRYFIGPDKCCYKWKLEPTHCWMKLPESNAALARFHKKNFGIRKQSHPPYLDVSTKVVPMLDHVILTYVYVESLRRERNQSDMRDAFKFNNVFHSVSQTITSPWLDDDAHAVESDPGLATAQSWFVRCVETPYNITLPLGTSGQA